MGKIVLLGTETMELLTTVFQVWERSCAEVVCIPHPGLCVLDTGQPKEPQLFYEACFGAGLFMPIFSTSYACSMDKALGTVCVL